MNGKAGRGQRAKRILESRGAEKISIKQRGEKSEISDNPDFIILPNEKEIVIL